MNVQRPTWNVHRPIDPVGGDSGRAGEWHGAGARRRKSRAPFRWRTLLWSMVFPRRGQRIAPTLPGVLLIALSLGIGVAAYNTANNILFITLSLLLACLILSGVLSWLNFKGVVWRLQALPPWRVGGEHPVVLELRNDKKILPTYGLWFDLTSDSAPEPVHLLLRDRLDPGGGEARIDWAVRPAKRGIERVQLINVGSLFPFGFLKKNIGAELVREILVWPAAVEYRRFPVAAWQHPQPGAYVSELGHNGDLHSLRKYQAGDSHRLIHWKASARLRKLMTRQFAAEAQEGFSLWLETPADVWTRSEQFELLVRFAATLAEDLFKAEKLGSVAINEEPPTPVRGLSDVETFLDRLAVIQPQSATPRAGGPFQVGRARRGARTVMTFAPDGPRGVLAYVDGEKAAAT